MINMPFLWQEMHKGVGPDVIVSIGWSVSLSSLMTALLYSRFKQQYTSNEHVYMMTAPY